MSLLLNPPRHGAPGRGNALLAVLMCGLAFSLALAPALLPAAAQAATVQGSGTAASEMRTVPEFQAIATKGSIDIIVRQGAQPSVQVQADDNLLPLLETVVEGGSATLQVRWKRGESLSTRAKVLVTVVTPRLGALASAGSGDIRLETFNTPALQLSLAGSGDARLENLSTEALTVSIAGSGDVSGKGSAGKTKVSIAGSGDVRLMDLRSDDVTVSIAGSGDAAVNAQRTLTVSIAGSGDVVYAGNAQVTRSVIGSGSVTKK